MAGLRCVHLQCHIGTDTLSLARRGAASVTGLDFSAASLAEARRLAAATNASGGDRLDFVQASVYDALDVLPRAAYDLVFTGIGALCWIPDVRRWAAVVAGLLKPGGGKLFIREGHPMLWAMDDKTTTAEGALVVKYPYFERGGQAQLFDEGATYVQHDAHEFEHTVTAEFNHGLGEIVQALLDAGLRVTGLTEHQSVSWDALPGQMEEIGRGGFFPQHYESALYRATIFDPAGGMNADHGCCCRRIRAQERALETTTHLYSSGCKTVSPYIHQKIEYQEAIPSFARFTFPFLHW